MRLWFVLLWAALTAGAASMRVSLGISTRGPLLLLESAVYLSILYLLCGRPELRARLLALPFRYRFFLAALFLLTIFAQLTLQGRAYFPFVRWDMYTVDPESDTVSFFRIYGAGEEGQRRPIHPTRVVRPAGKRRILTTIDRLITALETAGDPAARAEPREQLERLIRQIGRLANRVAGSDPIQEVTLYRCRVSLESYHGADTPVEETLILRVPLADDHPPGDGP